MSSVKPTEAQGQPPRLTVTLNIGGQRRTMYQDERYGVCIHGPSVDAWCSECPAAADASAAPERWRRLLRCPFCGASADDFEDGEIQCSNRKCEVQPHAFSEEAWNTRADLTGIDRAIKVVEKMRDAWKGFDYVERTAFWAANEILTALLAEKGEQQT